MNNQNKIKIKKGGRKILIKSFSELKMIEPEIAYLPKFHFELPKIKNKNKELKQFKEETE
jgi:hypothetical protein